MGAGAGWAPHLPAVSDQHGHRHARLPAPVQPGVCCPCPCLVQPRFLLLVLWPPCPAGAHCWPAVPLSSPPAEGLLATEPTRRLLLHRRTAHPQCHPVLLQILAFYQRMGMPLPEKPPLLLVEGSALNEAEGRQGRHTHDGKQGPVFHTRGLCLTVEYRCAGGRKAASCQRLPGWSGNHQMTKGGVCSMVCKRSVFESLQGLLWRSTPWSVPCLQSYGALHASCPLHKKARCCEVCLPAYCTVCVTCAGCLLHGAGLLERCPPTCCSTIRHVVRGSRGRGGTRMGIEQQAADVSGRTRCEVRAPHMTEQLPLMCCC